MTKPPSKQDKKRQTASEASLRSGLEVYTGLSMVIREWRPVIVAQEAAAGSKSVTAAAGLARAQQACGDAIYRYVGAMPLFVTQQSVKKRCTGNMGASKDEVEAAVRALWPGVDFDALLTTPPIYLAEGQRVPARGKWENGFDAAAVAHCVRDEPPVVAARRMA